MQQVILGDAVVLEGVVDQPAQERNIRAGANLEKKIRDGSGAGKARIDHDQLGVAGLLGFNDPFETAGMILGGVSAHDQHHVGILDVDPAIRHGPAPECWSQT